jgi:hypothetical protein
MTAVGTNIRPCWNAVRLEHSLAVPPRTPARLGKVFEVDAVTHNAVRIAGGVWVRRWVRVTP